MLFSAMEHHHAVNQVRINLVALYREKADLRLFVMPGDSVICGGDWTTVTDVRVHRAGRHTGINIRRDWDAIEIVTDKGSRWFGYPPRTLPKVPVNRRRPLW